MATKAAEIPLRLVALNQSMFPSPHKPITVDNQETTGHLAEFDILAACYLARVLTEPTT